MASKPTLTLLLAIMAFTRPGFGQQLKPLTYVGCFSSSSGLSTGDTYQYQSTGHCQGVCVESNDNAPVLGLTNGNQCLCGTQTPQTSSKVDDSKCNTPCTGYGADMCGGSSFYSVYLTGTEDSVGSVGGGSATTGTSKGPTSTSAASPSVITSISPGQTVIVTQSASANAGNESPSASAAPSKTNTGAIVAGAVVGVVAVAAIAGGIFFFLRHRRRRQAEEEYKQHQVGDFMAGGKPTIPARKPSGPDSRFDAEAMAHRRLSDGSIADNEDYSRRILKVTNPDDGR